MLATPVPDPLGPPASVLAAPGPVRVALGMATVLACYAGAMGFTLIPVGLFVGPHILAAAAVHLAVAAIFSGAAWGLARRAAWGRWLLIAASASGMVVIPAAPILDGTVDPAGRAWFGGIAIYCAVMLGACLMPPVAAWCSGSSGTVAGLPTGQA